MTWDHHGGDTRMSDSVDPIPLEHLFVPFPPIFHDIFIFQVCDDERQGYVVVTQNF